MFCKNCGHEIPDDSNFCSKCGHPQKRDLTQPTTQNMPSKKAINESPPFMIDIDVWTGDHSDRQDSKGVFGKKSKVGRILYVKFSLEDKSGHRTISDGTLDIVMLAGVEKGFTKKDKGKAINRAKYSTTLAISKSDFDNYYALCETELIYLEGIVSCNVWFENREGIILFDMRYTYFWEKGNNFHRP